MTETRPPYRLRLPGPTAVPERVRLALASPVVNHRGPEFMEMVEETVALLRQVAGTSNDIMLFAASGTGMMEASMANVLGPDDKLLVIANGQFSERFVSICEGLGRTVDSILIPWGEAVDPRELDRKLASDDYRAVVAVHNESSTGTVGDLAEIGAVVRKTPALLVVDSVSGLGGIEMRQDDWGVDVLISASQKALMCPPGLALVSVSDKAWQVIDKDEGRSRFYWDFRKARDAAGKNQTAFTPPVPIVAGLREALRMMSEEGIPNVLARHHRLSDALRTGGQALGLALFPRSPLISDTVAVFHTPEGHHGGKIARHMYETYGTVIAGARNKLDGKVFRFGTMGYLDDADIMTDLLHLERTLDDLGIPVERGAGMTAAEERLRTSNRGR